MHDYYVYIMTNRKNGVLYTGITNDIRRRVWEHKQKVIAGFTSRYNITQLVYLETTADVNAAIRREKQIKTWRRSKKVALIEEANPGWKDLGEDWYD